MGYVTIASSSKHGTLVVRWFDRGPQGAKEGASCGLNLLSRELNSNFSSSRSR